MLFWLKFKLQNFIKILQLASMEAGVVALPEPLLLLGSLDQSAFKFGVEELIVLAIIVFQSICLLL